SLPGHQPQDLDLPDGETWDPAASGAPGLRLTKIARSGFSTVSTRLLSPFLTSSASFEPIWRSPGRSRPLSARHRVQRNRPSSGHLALFLKPHPCEPVPNPRPVRPNDDLAQ